MIADAVLLSLLPPFHCHTTLLLMPARLLFAIDADFFADISSLADFRRPSLFFAA